HAVDVVDICRRAVAAGLGAEWMTAKVRVACAPPAGVVSAGACAASTLLCLAPMPLASATVDDLGASGDGAGFARSRHSHLPVCGPAAPWPTRAPRASRIAAPAGRCDDNSPGAMLAGLCRHVSEPRLMIPRRSSTCQAATRWSV